MRALLFGVEPDPWTPSDPTNPLMAGMVTTPMKLTELAEPHPERSDWVMAKTRLTGICGSDAKHVFQDFGGSSGDNPMNAFFTYPTVLGREVVDEVAIVADPFAVSPHSVTRHLPPPGGKALVDGAGALGTCATAILRVLHSDVDVLVVARFPAEAALSRSLGATVVNPGKAGDLIEEIVDWSGGTLLPAQGEGLPMAHPGGIDVVYDTVGTNETAEVAVRVLEARGTLVKSGMNAPGRWEWTPLYFKEISWVGSNAFGVEEVGGVRMYGIRPYLQMVEEGRVDISPMLTHTFCLKAWHSAFEALATQQGSGAIKVALDFR